MWEFFLLVTSPSRSKYFNRQLLFTLVLTENISSLVINAIKHAGAEATMNEWNWNEFSNSSQFAVQVVLSATRDCIQFLSAMKILLHISEDNARRAPFMGSSAAGAVRSYLQLVLCSYNTFFSQSMHTLSLKNVGYRSFIIVETTSGSSEGEHASNSHSISLMLWKVKHSSSDDSYTLGSRLKFAG